ncbi:VOC family protein [Algibacter sp. L1A34]|uniref:VOC family protein n=1 Tax=Algibacter sp. L1A34 TaxID=2686365 RepID=UPI00131E107E|nr:VOC family protein [Algibacter sp. L1A34]
MENNHINYIELYANNLESIKSFYQKCFNWEFTDYGPDYIAFKNSGLEGGFEYTDSKIINGSLVVLYHANLLEIKAKIEAAGGTITKDVFMFPGGSRFQFLDPSGNELAVWCSN